MKYDLKTGLDILKMPCLLKVANDTLGSTLEDTYGSDVIRNKSKGCRIKFEKNLCVCFVRARILDLDDIDWFKLKKGAEFVRSHSLMVGSEILIPLYYGGKIRLYERTGGRTYYNIREVIEDFPRFVRVDKDTVCVSPGIQTTQIVYKGTILELDRITKSIQNVRGSRETYLICVDNENSRELAFRQLAPIQFTKVPDMTKDNLKDFVEHLPLPQVVEFLNINPYDVISVDDDDARDVLVMLAGPIELLGLQLDHFVVGKVDEDEDNICDLIAVPAKENVINSFYVHIPVERDSNRRASSISSGEYVDLAVSDDRAYDCLEQKLYLRYTDDDTPLIVRTSNTEVLRYEVEELPDTPPLPDKHDECSLKHTLSEPSVNSDSKTSDRPIQRRRFFSANDYELRTTNLHPEREHNGIKTYISQLSRRMKSTASQILFGIEAFSGAVDQDLEFGGKQFGGKQSRPSIREKPSKDENVGFICYIDTDLTYEKSLELNEVKFKSTECSTSERSDKGDVIYASVDVLKKTSNAIQLNHPCPFCRESLKMNN